MRCNSYSANHKRKTTPQTRLLRRLLDSFPISFAAASQVKTQADLCELALLAGGLPVPVSDRCSLARTLQTRWRLFPVWVCAFQRSKETFFTPWKSVQREACCTVLSGKRRKRGKVIFFLFLSGWSSDGIRSCSDVQLQTCTVCGPSYCTVNATGRLKRRLIYISKYESESGKISAQPHTFIMYEVINSLYEYSRKYAKWMYGTVRKSLPCGYADWPWMLSNSWHVIVYRKTDRLLSVLMDEFQK